MHIFNSNIIFQQIGRRFMLSLASIFVLLLAVVFFRERTTFPIMLPKAPACISLNTAVCTILCVTNESLSLNADAITCAPSPPWECVCFHFPKSTMCCKSLTSSTISQPKAENLSFSFHENTLFVLICAIMQSAVVPYTQSGRFHTRTNLVMNP